MLVSKIVFCVLFTTAFWNYCCTEETGPLVSINLGVIRGTYMKTLTGRRFSAFRGIPYAKPPIGKLRFKPPEKLIDPWTSQPFDASRDGAACPQYDIVLKKVLGQEDCLVINVYTPELPSDVSELKNVPVMVFIHGGGFNFGEGSSFYYGPRRLLDHDVILVTFNYRLGLFGFLSTGDEASPGNNGLLDQVAALKWIQENIQAFGGDSHRVMLFGESAGGASVSYHLLSELSKELFHGAIVMSGTTLAPWAFDDDPAVVTKQLAIKVGCAKRNSQDIVECLRKLPMESFAKPMKEIGENYICPFRPTLDGNFLTDHPLSLIQKGERVNRVPLMLGITANEGIVFYGFAYGNSIPEISDNTIQRTIAYAENLDEKMGGNAVNMVKKRYFPKFNSYTPEIFQNKLIQLFRDCMVDAPFYYNLNLYLENGMKPYVYRYDYFTNHSISKLFALDGKKHATHADDLYFVFDNGVFFPEDHERLNDDNENKFLELFVNFAKYNNPNFKDDTNSAKWIPATKDNPQIYQFDDSLKLSEVKIDQELNDFWMTKVPQSLHQEKLLKDEL